MRCLARDLGPDHVRVNTLVPSWVMTEKQLRLWVNDATRAEITRSQCISPPIQAENISRMALFLTADDGAMCTGQDFIVDGGWV
jgi:NAD(P)-dependent dehydrogenase (short-subunit alcohol dehydrogenase family)